MSAKLVGLGNFAFRYRGYLLPVAVLLLLIPSPRFTADPAVPGLIGFLIAVAGQVWRICTIGLAYIIRGGKGRKVYAEELVTAGLYGHVRNPMYVGNTFLIVGLVLASNSWVFALIGAPLALGMHTMIVAAEESFLRHKFGAQFDAYCARVPRWVPRLSGLFRTIRSMTFDWRRVIAKEYAATFDWFSAVAVMVLIKLGHDGLLDNHQGLTALMFAVVLLRFALWFVARQINRSTDTAAGESLSG